MLHGVLIACLDPNDSTKIITFVYDFTSQSSKEDSFAAISTLELALKHWKSSNPELAAKYSWVAHLATDGAGALP